MFASQTARAFSPTLLGSTGFFPALLQGIPESGGSSSPFCNITKVRATFFVSSFYSAWACSCGSQTETIPIVRRNSRKARGDA